MGRIPQNFKIPPKTFCSTMNHIDKPLYARMKELAKSKAMSVHTLIEICLERYLQEQERMKR